MNYEEAVQYIHNTVKFGSKLGLTNITELLKRLGDPHKKFPSVHVAGTNGKGSVTSMTTSILHQAGYKVGMFISPYLERFTERIQVNFQEIPGEELALLVEQVKVQVDAMVRDGHNHPTEFEIVTTLGFLWFAKQKVDIAVVEVGLGGRLDSTNVINPLVSVITSISFDHTRVLGNTLSDIAFEKGGIIKPGVPVVSYPQQAEAEKVIKRLAAERGCSYYGISPDQIREIDTALSVQHFDFTFQGRTWKSLAVHLPGKHQQLNAACAITAIQVLKEKGFNITDEILYAGLNQARWPGRLEVMGENPIIMLDGAHNPSGAQALVDAIRLYFHDKQIYLILGVLHDKDVSGVTNILCSIADRVIVTKPDSHRATSPEELATVVARHHSNVTISQSVSEAINLATEWVKADEDKKDGNCNETIDKVIIISGSLYLVGEARTILRNTLEK
jgi:dihydrofolate synthase/folylpolyglutamate synthase